MGWHWNSLIRLKNQCFGEDKTALNHKTLGKTCIPRKFIPQKQWRIWGRKWRSQFLIALSLLLCFVPSLFAGYAGSTPVSFAPSQWVSTGQTRYQSGQFAEAAIAWQQAADAFAQAQDPVNQAMALSNLSLTEQRLEQWDKSKQSLTKSLDLLYAQPQTPAQKDVLAATLDIKGQLQLNLGRFDHALQTWQGAAKLYEQMGKTEAAIANQINQAQAMQSLGLYPRACQTLLDSLGLQPNGCEIGTTLSSTVRKPSAARLSVPLQTLGLRSLGNVFRIMGQSDKSVMVLRQGLQLAQNNHLNPSEMAAIYLALGNTARASGNQRAAAPPSSAKRVAAQSIDCLSDHEGTLDIYYQQAAVCYGQAVSAAPAVALQAKLNLFSLMVQTQQGQNFSALLPKIQADLAALPPSRLSVAAHLKFAQSLMCLQSERQPETSNPLKFTSPVLESCGSLDPSFQGNTLSQIPTSSEIQQLLMVAFQQSQQLEDQKSETNALGYLASISQQMGNIPEAVRLTEAALHKISAFETPELAYLWQWQLGRLYQLQAKPTEAIASYTSAFNILQSLRRDLVTADSDLQFAFRDSVEPVYRELVDLLLKSASPSQENLKQARDVIESLQLAELNNFFREACIEAHPQSIDQLDAKAAVIYGIILPKRLAVIFSLPGKPLRYFATDLKANSNSNANQDSQEVENTVGDLFATLNPFVDSPEPLRPQQKIYDWLIRPAATELEDSHIKTLIFVLDGVLRGVPVAVLHDGSQYLVEKYSLALTPGLQLLSSRSLSTDKLRILAGGVSDPRDGFAPLPGVKREFTEISEILPTETLLNNEFTRDRLRAKIENAAFPVVHLATHAQFSSRADDTFLLTWSERVNVKNLDNFLRERSIKDRKPIELLILSACQTAVGDKRATLGLAGVAVRSGARSTMATLWSVQDQSTANLMVQFYKSLNQRQNSKAEALRQGQLSLLHSTEYGHPYYWAPFVLVGNWL
jgi:CHAT domain-containing protein